MEEQRRNLKKAERGSLISLICYIIISTLKIIVGTTFNSSALFADGLNNFGDSINSVGMLAGLRYAQRPADKGHRYGHWKGEQIATLAMSFVILFIGLQLTITSIQRIINKEYTEPSPITAVIALFAAIVMFFVYLYNKKLSKNINSIGLKAAAKDNLVDAFTSAATAIAIFASRLGFPWIDGVMALIVGIIIVHTGFSIFRESAYALTDGFPIEKTLVYSATVNAISGVIDVKDVRGRTYGANIYLDITIKVDPDISVKAGHDITENIEAELFDLYGIETIDIHVEPAEN